MSKNTLKKVLKHKLQERVEKELIKEADSKTKIKQWAELKDECIPGNRPRYINELTRKQCNIILKTRGYMLPLKENQRNQYQDASCRFCKTHQESQKHILEECRGIERKGESNITYVDIFKDDNTKNLAEIANKVIKLMETVDEY